MGKRRKLSGKQKLRVLRRALVLPFVIAAVLLLPLALWSTWNSRVLVDVKVNKLTFDFLDSPGGVIVDPRGYESAHVVQRSSVELRDSTLQKPLRLAVAPDGALMIERPRLDDLRIQRKSRVSIERTDASALALQIRGRASALFTVPAGAAIECESCTVGGENKPRELFRTTAGADSLLTVGGADRLHVVFETTADPVIAENIHIAAPSFLSGSAASLSSSLVDDGKVTLRDVKGFEIPVLKSELFSFDRPHDFVISKVAAVPQGLHVVMAGRSWQLRTGTAGAMAQRYPSLLERIHSNQKLAVYFAALLFLATTAVQIFRQLRLIDGDQR